MPDQIIGFVAGVPMRYRDMGDGTFAQVVAGPGGPAVVASDTFMPDIQPVLDTAAYASGDVLFVATEIANAAYDGRPALLASVTLIDRDDVGAALDLYFFSESVSMGAINAASGGLSDAHASEFLGRVTVAAGDWEDVGGARIAHVAVPGNRPLGLRGDAQGASVAGMRSVWMVGVTRGTPTHTAAGLIIRPFVVR